VFTPTRNATELSTHRSNKMRASTWRNTRTHTWR